MKNVPFTILMLASIFTTSFASNKITGTVIDDNDNSRLVGANVMLTDSTAQVIAATATDNDGKFTLEDINDGSFILQISYMGYTPQSVALTNLDKDVDLGTISLVASSTVLNEVVVEGDAVINKIDRQIILPTTAQRKVSTNGISLLQHMQVPSLVIDPLDKSVKTGSGKDVQLRINGVESTKDEVLAINPSDVVRIEYHDMPGLRYGNAAAVVDYIVKKKTTGGNIAGDLTNGVKPLGAGDYNLSARYNFNKSALSAVFSYHRRDLEWIRENYETFIYPDHTLQNREMGNPTKFKFDKMNLSISYNYANDRNMLNIAFRNSYDNTPNSFSDRNSTLYQDDTEYDISYNQRSKSYIPSLDIYYQLNLKNDRHLYLDVVGTYLKSSNDSRYSMTNDAITPDEIISHVDGEKYSIIGEAIYEMPLWNGTFTAGAKYNQSRTQNIYDGNISSKVNMEMSEAYMFAEFRSHVNKLNYIIGIGGMRTYYEQEEMKQEKYIVRPTLTLSYNFTNNIYLKYNAYVSGYSPSLADLSDVMQEMDAYQVRHGNPSLSSVTFYTNSLTAGWNSRHVNVELSGQYSYDDKPIMEETLYENGKFIRTYANQRGFHRLNLQATVQVLPFKEYMAIRLTPFFNRYISNGNDYTHTHSNCGFRGSIMGMYKNWSMMIDMNTSYHNLWGETLEKGEKLHSIAVGYNTHKWGIQMMLMNPFTKRYSIEAENLSRLAPYSQLAYSDDFKRMVMINFSFNLDFGKLIDIGGKRINNSDTDTGILSGSK